MMEQNKSDDDNLEHNYTSEIAGIWA
jgi:hypothetical protein